LLGTIFAYGQTGTGKTWTMSGYSMDPELRGIIPNTFEHIFDRIATEKTNEKKVPNFNLLTPKEHLVRAAFIEIYNEEIRDLLSKDPKKKMDLKEHPDTGVYVKDLSQYVVTNIPEMEKYMEIGNGNRSVGETKMNATSSRSHSIFTITIETSELQEDGSDPKIRAGKLHLVDLAGSERQSKTEAEGQRLKEAAKINLSLTALGNVIGALTDPKATHVPYRDSKLTRLLQDSLGGNAKTVMIANCGPADYNYDETISTLRYANRTKNIKNAPKINEDPKDTLIRQFQEEIELLKKQLQGTGGVIGAPGAPQTIIEEVIEEEVVEGVDPELLKQLKSQKEEEINAILSQKGYVEEEKKKIQEQLQRIQEKQQKHNEEKNELLNKLSTMQV
jgi:hypothetical protein